MARAEPDGYTLILGTNQTHATNQSLIKNWPYRRGARFRAGRRRSPRCRTCWWSARTSRRTSVGDVVALAKAKPGTLTFGSTGNGSGAHLAGELFKTKAGIDLLHVPFKGLSPMTTEMLADRIDLSIAPLPGPDRAADRGRQRARARHRQRPARRRSSRTVPTFAEAGVAGVEADAWSALFAPAKTPPAVIDRL